jgi:hypothetical protein
MLIRQAGASPRSSPPFRRPAPCLSLRPNSRIASASLDESRPRTTDAVAGERVGLWGRRPTENAGHAPLIETPGLDHGVGHFRTLSMTQQRHVLAYHFIARRHEGLCQVL